VKFPAPIRIPGVPLPLLRAGTHPCPYLPGRTASDLVALSAQVDSATYQLLMDRGFRRSGDVIYKPDCPACRECVPIRVPVDRFVPSRSQRRALRKNQDLTIETGPPQCDDERYALFERYQTAQHDGKMLDGRDEYRRFLCESPIDTLEISYRTPAARRDADSLGASGRGRLVGVGIVDLTPQVISSVYFYFDPSEAQRSLGVFSALFEIELCRRMGKRWWYVGFHVRGCRKMEYKADYRPHELLRPDGTWGEPRVADADEP